MMQKLSYFFSEGLKGLRGHMLMTAAAIGTIAATMLITGCFGLIAANLQLNMDQLMGDREFLAYLEDGLTQEAYDAVGQSLLELEGVQEATFISNKEALEERQSGDSLTSDFFHDIDYSLLQNRYHVVVTDVEALERSVSQAEALEGVDHVYASYSLAQQIATLRDRFLTGVLIIIAVLALISVFIISNVVRLAVAAREDEIVIMRLVGATKAFIRAPFLVEGMLIGLTGGLLAFAMTSGVYLLAAGALADGGGMVCLYTYRAVCPYVLLGQVAAGLLTGVVGTVMSMRRALRA